MSGSTEGNLRETPEQAEISYNTDLFILSPISISLSRLARENARGENKPAGAGGLFLDEFGLRRGH